MPSRSMDWLKQAKRDLEEAEGSLNNEKYEWACFASQQSAEKAVKALYHSTNKEIWSHSVSRMLSQLTEFNIDNFIRTYLLMNYQLNNGEECRSLN